jgi:hypothetical protein
VHTTGVKLFSKLHAQQVTWSCYKRSQFCTVSLASQGGQLYKYGRHGKPKYHYFRLAEEDTELQWESKGVSGAFLVLTNRRIGAGFACVVRKSTKASSVREALGSGGTGNEAGFCSPESTMTNLCHA